MRGALWVVASIIAASAWPASAAAQRVVHNANLVGGPAVLGDGAVYATQGHRGVRLKIVRPGERVRVLHQYDRPLRMRRAWAGVRASGNRVVVRITREHCYESLDGSGETECEYGPTRYYAGAVGDAPRRILRCDFPPDGGDDASVDASGAAVAYIGCGGAIKVRASASAAPITLRPPAGFDRFSAVRLAGRFVAGAATTDYEPGKPTRSAIVVFDRVERRQLFRIDGRDDGFDVQEDGTLAFVRARPLVEDCRDTLAWATPAEPRAHRIGARACFGLVALSGGRIATNRSAGTGRSRLVLTDLDGTRPMRIAPGYESPVDLDGSRLAYADEDCVDALVVADDVERALAHGPIAPATCPIRFEGRRPIRLRRDGVLAVRVSCPHGCLGELEVFLHGRRESFDGAEFKAYAGAVKTVAKVLLVDRRLRHRARRRKIDVVVRTFQPYGRTPVARRTVRLRTTRR